ncbi:MAG: cell division protein FtsA [Treponema sp.]|nr:cell division protein FtsA [Treponema sp.]
MGLTNIIVGLDIGTSFIRSVIGEVSSDGSVEIIGVAKKVSSGLRNGKIVNIEATMDCIKQVIEESEQTAGYEVISCVTGIGGAQVESMNTKGMVAVSAHGRNNREITQSDVARVLDAANAVQIPMDREPLHTIPREYIVDGTGGYKDPIHMIAVRLGAEVHVVTASRTAIKNITQCVTRAGYQLDQVILKTLACTNAVMTEEERDLGSILIDLGGGTTDVLVIVNDAPIFTASIQVGGNLVTNDIAIVKGISTPTAEKIKVEHGCCWLPLAQDTDEEVLIPGVAGRAPDQSSRTELCQIIQPRMEEIFVMVKDEIMRRTNVQSLSGSIILTGGGAQMEGAVQLAQNVFGTSSVRLGIPEKFGEAFNEYRSPEYATAVGLVVTYKNFVSDKPRKERKQKDIDKEDRGESLWQKIKKSFF